MGFSVGKTSSLPFPSPTLSLEHSSVIALETYINNAQTILESTRVARAVVRMLRGINMAFPELIEEYRTAQATPINLVDVAVSALERARIHESPLGWIHAINSDLSWNDEVSEENAMEVLEGLIHGIEIVTDTSDLYELSFEEMPFVYQVIYAFMGYVGDYDPSWSHLDEESVLPLTVAYSQAGLLMPTDEIKEWPKESKYWNVIYFIDASTENEVVDLRSGILSVGWEYLHILKESVKEAENYIQQACECFGKISNDNSAMEIFSWAGHLRDDMEKHLESLSANNQ